MQTVWVRAAALCDPVRPVWIEALKTPPAGFFFAFKSFSLGVALAFAAFFLFVMVLDSGAE
jgi:hypothetical protein